MKNTGAFTATCIGLMIGLALCSAVFYVVTSVSQDMQSMGVWAIALILSIKTFIPTATISAD